MDMTALSDLGGMESADSNMGCNNLTAVDPMQPDLQISGRATGRETAKHNSQGQRNQPWHVIGKVFGDAVRYSPPLLAGVALDPGISSVVCS